MSKQTERNKIILELKDYLEGFVRRYNGQLIHLIDISMHQTAMKGYDERLKKCRFEQERETK